MWGNSGQSGDCDEVTWGCCYVLGAVYGSPRFCLLRGSALSHCLAGVRYEEYSPNGNRNGLNSVPQTLVHPA